MIRLIEQSATALLLIAGLSGSPVFLSNDVCAEPSSARQIIQQATTELYQALDRQQASIEADQNHAHAVIETVLEPYTDYRTMAVWVMGKYWKQASPDQQQRFIKAFRQMLIRTYAITIRDVSPDQISYLPERNVASEDRAVVRTAVKHADDREVLIDYPMKCHGGRWKVYDIRIEGISLVTSYRTSYANEIRVKGIEGLIAELEQKNASQQASPQVR